MRIIACRYQVAKDTEILNGMAVLGEDGEILNCLSEKGTLVLDIWDIKLTYHVFNLNLVW